MPVLKRINELRAQAPDHIADAFTHMRERLNGIEERTKGWEFPEKVAEIG